MKAAATFLQPLPIGCYWCARQGCDCVQPERPLVYLEFNSAGKPEWYDTLEKMHQEAWALLGIDRGLTG